MSKNLYSLTLLAGLIFAGSAQAQTTFNVPVNHDQPRSFNAAAGDRVHFDFTFDNSFCCMIESASADAGARFDSIFYIGGASGTLGGNGDEVPAVVYQGTHSDPAAGRVCMTPVNSLNTRDFWLILGFDAAGTVPVEAGCVETTLFGGFNTSVTDFNFLEITNTADYEVNAYVTATNSLSATNEVLVNRLPVVVPAGRRVDVDIHSLTGAGKFGPVKITHDAAPGALRAIISQYNITSTAPLDFAPVNSVEFKTRKQLAQGW